MRRLNRAGQRGSTAGPLRVQLLRRIVVDPGAGDVVAAALMCPIMAAHELGATGVTRYILQLGG